MLVTEIQTRKDRQARFQSMQSIEDSHTVTADDLWMAAGPPEDSQTPAGSDSAAQSALPPGPPGIPPPWAQDLLMQSQATNCAAEKLVQQMAGFEEMVLDKIGRLETQLQEVKVSVLKAQMLGAVASHDMEQALISSGSSSQSWTPLDAAAPKRKSKSAGALMEKSETENSETEKSVKEIWP